MDKAYEKIIRWQPLTSLTEQKRFVLHSNGVYSVQWEDADMTKGFGGLDVTKNHKKTQGITDKSLYLHSL